MTPPSVAPAGHESPAAPRVLLIDDDPVQLHLTRTLLAAGGFTVLAATNASEGLEICRQVRPDAIISDVVMGDLDGFTLCRLFRTDPALAGVPVVLVTAHFNEQEDRDLAAHAGASALVERTPMFSAEIEALRRALRQTAPPPVPVAQGGINEEYARRMADRLARFLERARGAELRYQTLLDHANDAIAVLTPEGVVTEVNRQWEQIRQLPRDTLVGQHIREFAAPGHEESNVNAYRQLIGVGGGRLPVVSIARADGSHVYMELSTARVSIGDRDEVFTIGRDVTSTIEARTQLEASERRYRSLVENIPDVVWLATLDGQVTFISPNVERVCGFSAAELVAAPASFHRSRVHPEDVERVRAAYAALQTAGGYEAEFRWQRKDGEWIWIRSRAMPVRSEDGTVLAEGTFADVTEMKRLEDQVRQSQKMEAIGRLTSGIAHDFNNVLAIILGNGQMLLQDLPEDDRRRDDVSAILEAAGRAAALTSQLLMFSRREIVRPTRLDVNGVVTGLERMLGRIIGEDVEVCLSLAESACVTLADPVEIEQVILNLVVNARDAMPDGGTLTIETRSVELDTGNAVIHPDVEPGRYVMLSVTDSGCGMDADTKRRAFEPFFTTKAHGKGTGLGLSTCYGIVKRCGGHIGVHSQPGHGSVFNVYLPCGGASVDGATASRISDARTAGTETILLIEDDDMLLATIGRTLTAQGYTVLDARGSNEALAVCEHHDGPIHLVVSDMVMPGVNGPDGAARIREHRPDVKVLFMSGYSDHALLQNGRPHSGLNFIQKPFTPREIAAKVRQVLDA